MNCHFPRYEATIASELDRHYARRRFVDRSPNASGTAGRLDHTAGAAAFFISISLLYKSTHIFILSTHLFSS
jgi:hypothetical protein